MPDDPVPEKQSTSPPLTGSRRRGPPDERHYIAGGARGPKAEITSRQIALAYEREAIRLRRHRLEYPEPLQSEAERKSRRRSKWTLAGFLFDIATMLMAWRTKKAPRR